jgi:hypothetical protein
MRQSLAFPLSAVSLLVALAGCGGGGTPEPAGDASAAQAAEPDAAAAGVEVDAEAAAWSAPDVTAAARRPPTTATPTAAPVLNLSATTADRMAAAAATAQSSSNECAPIRPFYWEIGDKGSVLASGSMTSTTTATRYDGTTSMQVASASKWVYGTYVAQKLGGQLSESDRKFLRMSAGYNDFTTCQPGQTVGICQAFGTNGVYTAAEDGKFDYGGGHMQKHAVLMGLGAMAAPQLTTEVRSKIGTEIAFNYSLNIAGGVSTTPQQYAKMLRKIMNNELQMGTLLGSGAVCTNPRTCANSQALRTPVPMSESWHYSVGHWIEDDPILGDGSFSSPGAFGFYPWIDASKQFYGIVARQASTGAGVGSVNCGRKIRKAWLSGVAQ